MQDFEKLEVFYLGAEVDPATRKRTDDLLLYDSRDLVTHAVCVGMTGSGKTGLCLDLLEEAAIDGVPALLIDPKGDLGNLLLTFRSFRGSDFRPWINEDDARRQGIEPDAFAEQQAELWKQGLADWGQQPDRIQRLRDAAEFAIYTPGSLRGGRSVSLPSPRRPSESAPTAISIASVSPRPRPACSGCSESMPIPAAASTYCCRLCSSSSGRRTRISTWRS